MGWQLGGCPAISASRKGRSEKEYRYRMLEEGKWIVEARWLLLQPSSVVVFFMRKFDHEIGSYTCAQLYMLVCTKLAKSDAVWRQRAQTVKIKKIIENTYTTNLFTYTS